MTVIFSIQTSSPLSFHPTVANFIYSYPQQLYFNSSKKSTLILKPRAKIHRNIVTQTGSSSKASCLIHKCKENSKHDNVVVMLVRWRQNLKSNQDIQLEMLHMLFLQNWNLQEKQIFKFKNFMAFSCLLSLKSFINHLRSYHTAEMLNET